MRKIFYIFLLLLLFSCSNSKNEQLYIEYIEQFELLTAFNDYIIQKNVNRLTYLMNDLTRNPKKYKPWVDEINIVKTKSDSVFNEIEGIKIRILSDKNVTRFKLEEIKNSRNRISKIERNKLRKNIKILEKFLIAKIEDLSHRKRMAEDIKKIFSDIDILFEQSILKGKKSNSLEIYALLTMIQYNIRTVETNMIYFFLKHIDVDGSRFIRIGAVVAPEVKTILRGEEYKAEIFLTIIDTTINPKIIIGEQTLNSNRGKVLYKKLISIGTFSKYLIA